MAQEATKPHVLYVEDENGRPTDQVLAYVHPADPDDIVAVLDAPAYDDNGRSEFVWVRLQNGDLILGVFPRGDIYFHVEEGAQYPREET